MNPTAPETRSLHDRIFVLCPAVEHPMRPAYCRDLPHRECVGCTDRYTAALAYSPEDPAPHRGLWCWLSFHDWTGSDSWDEDFRSWWLVCERCHAVTYFGPRDV